MTTRENSFSKHAKKRTKQSKGPFSHRKKKKHLEYLEAEVEPQEGHLSRLPPELMGQIVQHLESKSYVQFSRTCKTFQALCCDPYLWKRHIQNVYDYGFGKYLMRNTNPPLAPQRVSTLLHKLEYIKGLIYEKEYQDFLLGGPGFITCLYSLDARDPFWQRGKQFLFPQMLQIFNFPPNYFSDQYGSSTEDMDLSWNGLVTLHRQRLKHPGCDVKFYNHFMECLANNCSTIEALYDSCVETKKMRTLARLLEGHRVADTPIFKAIRDVQILDGDEIDELYDMAEDLDLENGSIMDLLMDHLFNTHPYFMTNKDDILSGYFDIDLVLRYMNNCADLYRVVDEKFKSWCLFSEYDFDSLEHYESLGLRYYDVQTLYTSFLWDLHYRQSSRGALWDPSRAKEEVVCWMNQLWTCGTDILIRKMAVKRIVQRNAWLHLMPEIEGSNWYRQYLEEGDANPMPLSKLQEEMFRREQMYCSFKELNARQRVHKTQKRLVELLLPQTCYKDVTYYDGPAPCKQCARPSQYRRLHKLVRDYIDTGKEETLVEIRDFILLTSFLAEEENVRVPMACQSCQQRHRSRRNTAVTESHYTDCSRTETHAQTTACFTSRYYSATKLSSFALVATRGRNYNSFIFFHTLCFLLSSWFPHRFYPFLFLPLCISSGLLSVFITCFMCQSVLQNTPRFLILIHGFQLPTLHTCRKALCRTRMPWQEYWTGLR